MASVHAFSDSDVDNFILKSMQAHKTVEYMQSWLLSQGMTFAAVKAALARKGVTIGIRVDDGHVDKFIQDAIRNGQPVAYIQQWLVTNGAVPEEVNQALTRNGIDPPSGISTGMKIVGGLVGAGILWALFG